MVKNDNDERWMRVALSLGRRGMGQVWPNPSVGCLIVNHGRLIGRGWTAQGGRPHAEQIALEMAGKEALGASMYVTLEPCAHRGKSPPCVEAIIKAGIGRVVYALIDPDIRVSGKGIKKLKEAGLEISGPILEDLAQRDHRGFLSRITQGRPHISLKLASSLDGKIATKTGESKWITGFSARQMVQGLRARHDAILIGAGTARFDDPKLTLRLKDTQRRAPLRIVVSRMLDIPKNGNLAKTAQDGLLYLAHSGKASASEKQAWRANGAHLIEICDNRDYNGLDLEELMQILGKKGLTRILVEGGGQIGANLLKVGLVDELIQFYAGKILGADARAAIGHMNIQYLKEAPVFTKLKIARCGDDIMQSWS